MLKNKYTMVSFKWNPNPHFDTHTHMNHQTNSATCNMLTTNEFSPTWIPNHNNVPNHVHKQSNLNMKIYIHGRTPRTQTFTTTHFKHTKNNDNMLTIKKHNAISTKKKRETTTMNKIKNKETKTTFTHTHFRTHMYIHITFESKYTKY